MIRGYDAWKTRSPDDDRPDPEFSCIECDDAGCPECCECEPITLDDLREIADQIELAQSQPPARKGAGMIRFLAEIVALSLFVSSIAVWAIILS